MKIMGEKTGKSYISNASQRVGPTEEECCAEMEITVRMGPRRRNWKKCRGNIVRRMMPMKLIRPAIIHGAETLAKTKRQEDGIKVNEMRMLRWIYG